MVRSPTRQQTISSIRPLQVIETPAVLSSSAQYLPEGLLSDLGHRIFNFTHVRRSIVFLTSDSQVRRIGLN
ncbi:hypothetical protein DPMN_047117 [Dreissena polymorpha]|uniref:Uncharacterized protein n=1 Tax=Dreissena polymorpha TaxID=45954 RepID=A0A9D4I2U5_DREPO|nr:hypothetical protein DPMN_047117 [Dreissena polymorpha]